MKFNGIICSNRAAHACACFVCVPSSNLARNGAVVGVALGEVTTGGMTMIGMVAAVGVMLGDDLGE
jgi:hypothetical protein